MWRWFPGFTRSGAEDNVLQAVCMCVEDKIFAWDIGSRLKHKTLQICGMGPSVCAPAGTVCEPSQIETYWLATSSAPVRWWKRRCLWMRWRPGRRSTLCWPSDPPLCKNSLARRSASPMGVKKEEQRTGREVGWGEWRKKIQRELERKRDEDCHQQTQWSWTLGLIF